MSALERLFFPRGVAFVGASEDTERYNGRVLQYALREPFAGDIHAVNPRYETLFGRPCHADLASVPGPVDVVVLLVGPSRIPAVLEQCRARGVGFAIALGDLAEPGAPDGEARHAALRRQAARSGPRLVGPVCVGVVSPHADLAMTMSSGMLAGPPPKGEIALVSQSGGVLSAVMDRAHQLGGGFSHLVSSGSELDLGLADFVEYLAGDSHTRCISLYAEKLGDPVRFFAACDRAREAGKPVVLLKAGRTETGARAALTHSGAIAGDATVADAAFRRHGILAVDDIDGLYMTARLLAAGPVDPEAGVGVVSQSGGYCAVIGDALTRAGAPLARLSAATEARIVAETPVAHVGNPLDSASGPPGNNAPNTRAALIAMRDDPAVGATLYAETMYMYQGTGYALQKEVAAHGAKPHVVLWQGGAATAPLITDLRASGMLVFDGMPQAMAALGGLYAHARLAALPVPLPSDAVASGLPLPAEGGMLDDRAAKALLAAHGVSLVEERRVADGDAAARAAADLGFPVVVKGLAPGIAHRSDHGLVVLGLEDGPAVAAACAAMAACAGRLDGFLVQPMVRDALEVIVGVKNDPVAGPAVVFGLGGVFVEALGAAAVDVAPLDAAAAARLVDAVDRRNILGGYRTGVCRDRAALERLLVAVGRLAWAERERLDGLDLNPVMVGRAGAAAVDVLATLRPAAGAMGGVAEETAA